MKKNIKTILWVALIVLIGFRLRLIGINKPTGIWFDEMIVYIQSQAGFPLGIIKNLIATDILMPLHHLFLAVWIKLFGNSDLALRMSSAIIGSLAIIGVYLTGAKAKDNKTGYIAALLFTLNGCAIYFSQEIKFYVLAMFFCTFNLYFFLRVSENQKDKMGWAGLITTCVLGCYTFSIYIFLAFVQFAYLFFETLKKKESLKYYWINSGIITTLLIPFLWLNIYISHNMKSSYAPSTLFLNIDASTFFSLFQNWMTPFVLNKFDNYINYFSSFYKIFNTTQVVEIFFVMGFMTFFIIYGLIKNDKARKLGIVGLSFFVLTCIAGVFLNFCLTVRYGVLFVPFIIVLAAIGLDEIKIKYLKTTLIVTIVVLSLFVTIFDSRSGAKADRSGLKPVAEVMKKYEFGRKDILFLPFDRVDLFDKYYKYKGMVLNSTLIYNEIAYKSFDIKNTGNIRSDFKEYLLLEKPTVGEKNFFNLNINNKMHKGHHIMIVKGATDNYNLKAIVSDDKQYEKVSFYFLPPYKFLNNILQMCEDEFGPGEFYMIQNWRIFVYKIK